MKILDEGDEEINKKKKISHFRKLFEKEEIRDYSQGLLDINCLILSTGIKESKNMFYICECDPERANCICETCFNECHKGGKEYPHREISSGVQNSVCYCGYKCHKPFSQSEKNDPQYKQNCTFGEWSLIPDLNFYYQSIDESNTKICLVCYNICYSNDKKLLKTTLTDLKGFRCNCSHNNHSDIKIIFRKLKSIARKSNFSKLYNFEGMTFIQFVNFFTNSKNSFHNIFHNFTDRIKSTYENLQKINYFFEEHNITNDLHLTSQVLLYFSQKCKDEYTIKNRIKQKPENEEDNNDFGDLPTKKINQNITVGIQGGEIESIKIRCRTLYYFNDIIKNILNETIFNKILERKFDFKSRNIWQLKYFLSSIFWTFYICKDFSYFPNFKIRDIVLLSPIQRLIMVSNIETEIKVSKYVNNLNENYLNNNLNSIEIMINSEEKSIIFLLILAKLYKICELFGKYSLFNHEQLSKLCQLNNIILTYFDEEKQNIDKDFLKLKVISPMLKCLVFLSFYYNDQLILRALKGESDISKINFFHGHTEICKNITQNVILILSFIQRFNDDIIQQINSKKEFNSETVENIQDILPQNQKYLKCLRHVIQNCNIILDLPLKTYDIYFEGLARLIDPTQEILFRIAIDSLQPIERDFIKALRYFCESLEDNYAKYFNEYNSQNNEEKFTQKIEDILTEFYKSTIWNVNDNNVMFNMNEESDELINNSNMDNYTQHSINNNNNINNIDNFDLSNSKSPQKNNFNIKLNNSKNLIIKSYILQSMMKYIHIMYESHISKKLPPEKFIIKQNLFKTILDILYNFVINNFNNAIFVLQSDFLNNFEFLNDIQLQESIDFINATLNTIALFKRNIPHETNLLHFIKVAVLKSSDLEILNSILKVLETCVRVVKFHNELKVHKKIMKIMKIIFNYHLIIKNYFTTLSSNRENDKLLCLKKEIQKIVKKFMKIVNSISTQTMIIQEKDFYDTITTKEQLEIILINNINISLRTELLQFYLNVYLETILDKKDINYYTSILIADFKIKSNEEIINNPKFYKFFEFLVKSGNYYENLIGLEKEANVVKYELLNINSLALTSDKKKQKNYLEIVMKCAIVYFKKCSSLLYELTMFNILSLYEIVYYTLELKKYIYSKKEVFEKSDEKDEKVLFKNKLNCYPNNKIQLINPVNIEKSEKKKNKYQYIIIDQRLIKKKKKKLNNPKNDEEKVYHDIRIMNDESFEFINYKNIKNIFYSHTKNFIKFQKVKGFKEYFEKKNEEYDKEKIKKMTDYLKKNNRFKTQYEQDIFQIIIIYANKKCDIENSTFIEILSETNAHYNTNYRMLLCKGILYLLNLSNHKYKDQGLWYLFRLLQYHTTEIQNSFKEIEQNNDTDRPLFDFNSLIETFTSSIITVLLREINCNGYENKHEYYNCVITIKIMKYFCEEHNSYFQTLFYNNTEVDYKYVIVKYKNNLCLRRKKRNNNAEGNDGEIINNNKRRTIFSIGSQISTDANGFAVGMYSRKASVFEYLLSVLGKIILISNWIYNKDDDLDEFFYDIYFVILEFLIETIQGTSTENLSKIFNKEKKSKNLFGNFLREINYLLLDDSNHNSLNYVIRKDMIDFVMAFIEESATPPNGIVEITNVILPVKVLDSILITMNKLYYDLISDNNNNNESKIENLDNNNINNNNKYANSINKKNNYFTPEMKKYFNFLYFNSLEFGENEIFSLANRMYHYFKMLGQNTDFKNIYVSEFYSKIHMFSDAEIINIYRNKNKKLINKITGAVISEKKFNDQFLCVSFFEEITRTVLVTIEKVKEPVSVIFTLNPNVTLLSKISKDDFIDNVDRENRSKKLYSLLERCDNFYEEIKYRQKTGKANFIIRFINDINFFYLETFSILITLCINIIMLIILKGEGDVLYGDNKINFILQYLGIINFCFNILCLILWLIAKFKLLYMTEKSKMIKDYKEKTKQKEFVLSKKDKLYAAYIVLIQKNKLFSYFWNIILSGVASFTGKYIFYIIQLFIIFNVSSALQNLLSSVTVKANQLASVFYLSIVVNLCLANIAFFNFEEDFTNTIPSKKPHFYPVEFQFLNDLIGGIYTEQSHIESECGTLIYCFATHMDYGMRFDGGIADRMSKRSYNLNKNLYLSRFFYEVIYFIAQTVMIQGMIYGIIIDAFTEQRNKEKKYEVDKKDICFICGIDRTTCEKNGQKYEDHINEEHNLWMYVDFILGLKSVDKQETNAINSYVIEKLEKKELSWFPMAQENKDAMQDN